MRVACGHLPGTVLAFMKLIHISLLVAGVRGHGSMIMPDSRNSVDASPGMPWADGKHPETGLIEPYTCACGNGTACFTFTSIVLACALLMLTTNPNKPGTDICSSGQV